MTTYNRLLLPLLLLMATTCAMAQDEKPRGESSLMVGLGATDMLDTYISQEEYSGSELRIVGQTDRRLSRHPAWRRSLTHTGRVAFASPRADNADYLAGLYTCNFAMRHVWTLGAQWTVEAGGQAEGGLGFTYSTRNSNNPAQAKIYLNVGPAAAATFRFHLLRKSMLLRYEVAAPLVGALFSPNYGQSYYEIFSRGNYDHNIVPTYPLCAPSLRHALTVNIPLRRASLRLGYLGDCQQAKVNDLKYHNYSHLFIIGYAKNL